MVQSIIQNLDNGFVSEMETSKTKTFGTAGKLLDHHIIQKTWEQRR